MCPSETSDNKDWCIFDKVGCTIDFNEAREADSVVDLHPYTDGANVSNLFEHRFGDEYWEIRDW